MWINSVNKYELFKKTKGLSKRAISLIKDNYSLIILVNLLPLNLRNNESYLYSILLKNKDLEIPQEIETDFKEFSLPYNDKKLFKMYIDFDFVQVLYCWNYGTKINTDLLKYKKIEGNQSLIDCLFFIKNKMEFRVPKESLYVCKDYNLLNVNYSEFKIKNDNYLFTFLSNPQEISLWSIYLNNCLDSYVKGKKINLFCNKTRTKHELSFNFLLEKGVINLIGIYKNNKPYACLELIDTDLKIRQILKKKNKKLDIVEQHNILMEVDRLVGKELQFSTIVEDENV